MFWLILGVSSDLSKDVTARHQGEAKYGYDVWFSGHRNGESGVENPNTDDIKGEFDMRWWFNSWVLQLTPSIVYKNAVAWIQEQIESDKKYQSDDTRFWVKVQAI